MDELPRLDETLRAELERQRLDLVAEFAYERPEVLDPLDEHYQDVPFHVLMTAAKQIRKAMHGT